MVQVIQISWFSLWTVKYTYRSTHLPKSRSFFRGSRFFFFFFAIRVVFKSESIRFAYSYTYFL